MRCAPASDATGRGKQLSIPAAAPSAASCSTLASLRRSATAVTSADASIIGSCAAPASSRKPKRTDACSGASSVSPAPPPPPSPPLPASASAVVVASVAAGEGACGSLSRCDGSEGGSSAMLTPDSCTRKACSLGGARGCLSAPPSFAPAIKDSKCSSPSATTSARSCSSVMPLSVRSSSRLKLPPSVASTSSGPARSSASASFLVATSRCCAVASPRSNS